MTWNFSFRGTLKLFPSRPVYLQSSLLGAAERGLHNVSNGARFGQGFVCVIYNRPLYSRGNWICKIRCCIINNLYHWNLSRRRIFGCRSSYHTPGCYLRIVLFRGLLGSLFFLTGCPKICFTCPVFMWVLAYAPRLLRPHCGFPLFSDFSSG